MTLVILLILVGFQTGESVKPDTVDLNYVYERTYENYPLVQKKELQEEITRLRTRIAETGYYPDISFSAMASYQSDVTEVNFVPPGSSPPTFSKDHYQVKLDVDQPIYTGGVPGIRKKLEQANGRQQNVSLEVDMHQVRNQVNQVYFSILLLQQQARSIRLLSNQLREQIKSVKSMVDNGVVLPGQLHILEAELIKTEQDSITTREDIEAGYRVLSELTGEQLSSEQPLRLPEIAGDNKMFQVFQPGRPEYDLFKSSMDILKYRKDLTNAQKVPKLSAFGTTAYGRPGLNAFDDNLQPYFIVGLRVRWNFWDWSNASREIRALDYRQQQVKAEEDAFTRQLKASLENIRASIRSLESVIERDRQIVALRENVVRETKSKLDNGTITSTEFVTELTKANQARLTTFLHEVRLVQQKIDYATKLGMSWKKIY